MKAVCAISILFVVLILPISVFAQQDPSLSSNQSVPTVALDKVQTVVEPPKIPNPSLSYESPLVKVDNTNPNKTLIYGDDGLLSEEINHKSGFHYYYKTITKQNGRKQAVLLYSVRNGIVKWYDKSAPVGSVLINNGDKETDSREVSLALNVSDELSGLDKMRFSLDKGRTWTAWEAFGDTKQLTLSEQLGTKTIYAQVCDKAGNCRKLTDTITLKQRQDNTLSLLASARDVYPQLRSWYGHEWDYRNWYLAGPGEDYYFNPTGRVTDLRSSSDPYGPLALSLNVNYSNSSTIVDTITAGAVDPRTIMSYQPEVNDSLNAVVNYQVSRNVNGTNISGNASGVIFAYYGSKDFSANDQFIVAIHETNGDASVEKYLVFWGSNGQSYAFRLKDYDRLFINSDSADRCYNIDLSAYLPPDVLSNVVAIGVGAIKTTSGSSTGQFKVRLEKFRY